MKLEVLDMKEQFYSRQEMAELFELDITDSKHFKRNLERGLTKVGFHYEYSRDGVTITHIPSGSIERLRAILVVALKLDVQIDIYAFCCFICAFNDIPAFESMPWEQREKVLSETYHISVSFRTLSNWCKRLIQVDCLTVTAGKSYWKTECVDGWKVRIPVKHDDEGMKKYREELFATIAQKCAEFLKEGMSSKEANRQAWTISVEMMWEQYHCCYYSCKTFMLGAFSLYSHYIPEIYELSRDIFGFQERPQDNKNEEATMLPLLHDDSA